MSIKVIEGIFIAALALGLGFWQLYDVNKALRDHDDGKDEAGNSPTADQDDPE